MKNLNLKKLRLEKNYSGTNPSTCVGVKQQEETITNTIKMGKKVAANKKYNV